jgi:hypothetical protein
MPQKRISIWTSVSVGSRRAIVVEASGDVALAAEKAFALYICAFMMRSPRVDIQKLLCPACTHSTAIAA